MEGGQSGGVEALTLPSSRTEGSGAEGLCSRVSAFEERVQGLDFGFGVWSLGFEVWGVEFGLWGLGFGV